MITVDQVFDAIPKELLGKDDLLVEVSERYIRGNEEDPGVDALVLAFTGRKGDYQQHAVFYLNKFDPPKDWQEIVACQSHEAYSKVLTGLESANPRNTV